MHRLMLLKRASRLVRRALAYGSLASRVILYEDIMKRILVSTLAWLAISLTPLTRESLQAAVPTEDGLLATQAVFELFESKCNDCHGAQLARPKGKFGYIMDLKRVAGNDEYIVTGDPSKSELYRQVLEDEMPGKDSKTGPATAAEKLALRRWIEAGSPTTLPPSTQARQIALVAGKTESPASPRPETSFLGHLLEWIGRFHAASTHFPIGLLVIAVLSEALGWFTKKETWLTCTRFLVVLGAASAVNTALLGWLNYHPGEALVYQTHKWMGTLTALWAIISAGSAVFFECREGSAERIRLRGALVVGAILISAVGFLGGAVTFGLDHYKW